MAKQRAVIEKIKKLIALSNLDKNNNINEALAAACRAQELINKHRLSYEKIMYETHGLNDSQSKFIDYIKHYETYFGGALNLPDWNRALIKIIADHNNCKSYACKVVTTNRETKQLDQSVAISLIGLEEDVLTVEELYYYLELEISKICIAELANGDAKPKDWRHDFCLGAVAQLGEKFVALAKKEKDEVDKSQYEGALVRLENRSAELERFFAHKKMEKQKTARANSAASFERGFKAAEKIAVQIDKTNMLEI